MAGDFPCDQVDLYSRVTLGDLGGVQNMNDIWGWTDSDSGREFAIVGLRNGTSFVEVTDPLNPVVLGVLTTASQNSLWRDIKVYDNYAFIVSEANDHGMQIFDLTKLLVDPSELTGTFEVDAWYQEFGDAHNIVINEETGYAYGVGTATFSGGLHVVDIHDPLNPVIAGGFGADGYTHDAQVINYDGPDSDYTGHEIAFACNEDEVSIIDVTDKTDMFLISTIQYPLTEYMHQGWLTQDLQFFLANDELDEREQEDVVNTRTLIFDIKDLDNPVLHQEFSGEAESVDHNLYNRGSLSYQSNYTSGLRILDLGNIFEQDVSQVGFFDCQPNTDVTEFFGTWSNYCYFESGTVVMTDMFTDLFILRPTLINAYRYAETCGTPGTVKYYIDTTWDVDLTDAQASDVPEGLTVSFGELVSPGVIPVYVTNTADLEDAIYDIPISLFSNGDELFSENLRLNVNSEVPSSQQIELTSPEDGFTTNEELVDLTWTAIEGAEMYTVTISSTEDMQNIIAIEFTSENTLSYGGLGEYFWSVSPVLEVCECTDSPEVRMVINNHVGVEELVSEPHSKSNYTNRRIISRSLCGKIFRKRTSSLIH